MEYYFNFMLSFRNVDQIVAPLMYLDTFRLCYHTKATFHYYIQIIAFRYDATRPKHYYTLITYRFDGNSGKVIFIITIWVR